MIKQNCHIHFKPVTFLITQISFLGRVMWYKFTNVSPKRQLHIFHNNVGTARHEILKMATTELVSADVTSRQ